MEVRFKKLIDKAFMPLKAHPGDAGFDLTAISKELVDNGDYGYIEYDTGIAIEIPEGYVGLVYPRSSVSKTGHILANSVGVIDSNYRGSVKLRFKTIPDCKEYNIGDRVGQLIIAPCPEIEFVCVDELSETDRGSNGFGSTNNT